MKKMTCRQLGGACDMVFEGTTFDAIAQQSKVHGQQMFQENAPCHLEAMEAMRALMSTPGAMEKWFADKKALFDSLPST